MRDQRVFGMKRGAMVAALDRREVVARSNDVFGDDTLCIVARGGPLHISSTSQSAGCTSDFVVITRVRVFIGTFKSADVNVENS